MCLYRRAGSFHCLDPFYLLDDGLISVNRDRTLFLADRRSPVTLHTTFLRSSAAL